MKFIIRGILLFTLLYTSSVVAETDQHLPQFNLASLDGLHHIQSTDYRGKVLYLDFWASWCTACVLSMPELNAMRADIHSADFELISINVDKVTNDGKIFLDKFKIDYPVASDASGTLMTKMAITSLPAGVLVDADGKIRLRHQGYLPGQSQFLKAYIDKLLAERSVTLGKK